MSINTLVATPPIRRVERRRVSSTIKVARTGWLFVAPFLVIMVVAVIAPLVYAVYLSLFKDQFYGGTQFVGLENYLQALQDPLLRDGLWHIAMFFAIQVPTMIGFALVAALALDSGRLRWAGGFRILLFLPYAVPGVVAVLIWGFMYGPNYGLLGSLNDLLGTEMRVLTPDWIMPSIANIATWQYAGYYMLLFYATLRTVPADLYEAAALDGASAFRIIRAVKLPALRGALIIALVFSIIGSFQLFNEPQLLSSLAPTTITSNFTPTLYTYSLAFVGQQYNYSAALSIVLGVVTALIAYFVQFRGTRADAR